ncbi:hypothetical protein [Providencia manganoxydans]|uniref:hypothetical protein n=1 Tax=Providencia manganoxydans TaxID=2923283 RepID=UPI0032DAEBAF
MGKMTFVVEYEDGKEPPINAGTEILGGRLLSFGFGDYSEGQLTQDEVSAINHVIDFSKLLTTCEDFEVDYDVIVAKL